MTVQHASANCYFQTLRIQCNRLLLIHLVSYSPVKDGCNNDPVKYLLYFGSCNVPCDLIGTTYRMNRKTQTKEECQEGKGEANMYNESVILNITESNTECVVMVVCRLYRYVHDCTA